MNPSDTETVELQVFAILLSLFVSASASESLAPLTTLDVVVPGIEVTIGNSKYRTGEFLAQGGYKKVFEFSCVAGDCTKHKRTPEVLAIQTEIETGDLAAHERIYKRN